jgi:hypothetical protein
MLTIVDEFTRECLAIDVSRKLTSEDVLERLSDVFVRRGVPDHIRSDNGSEFTAKRLRGWLERVGVNTLSIEPGSPWENGYVESFNGKLRDELLAREMFDTVLEAKVLVERWKHIIHPESTTDRSALMMPRRQLFDVAVTEPALTNEMDHFVLHAKVRLAGPCRYAGAIAASTSSSRTVAKLVA